MACITEKVAVIEQQQGWEHLFVDIKKSSQYDLTCKAAKLQENRHRNRYRDVSPFDHSRVKLQDGPSDYINSNLVKVADAERRYILSQGPLPGTSGHLWQMVWEQNSKAVVMLNKIIEKGMRKCHQYWPIDKNYPVTYHEDGYIVTLANETDMQNFVIREFELHRIKSRETRTVYHFHYTAWPDFDVPQSPAAFLNFLACIRQYGVLENHYGPAVIHCSAGIGRSGTFILIDACLELLQKGVPFEVRQILLEVRKFRMGLIQTPQQLRFSYFAIAECERILLFKQSEENGYSDTDAMSDDDSEVYDQLCRDQSEIFDADNVDDNFGENEIPEDAHLKDANDFTTQNSQHNPIDHSDKQDVAHCQTESNKHQILISNNNIKTEAISATQSDYATDIANTVETPVDSEEKIDDTIGINQETTEVAASEEEIFSSNENATETTKQDHYPLDPIVDEPNGEVINKTGCEAPPHPQYTPTHINTVLNSHDAHVTQQQNLEKPESLTSNHISSEDKLRKRAVDNAKTSNTNKTIKATDSGAEHFEKQWSWKPYIIGGCLVFTAFGLIASVYSKL